MNRCRWACLALGTALFLLAWLTLGVEETPREHGTDYAFFAKQRITLHVVFRNPAVCGECDVEPLDTLSTATQAALRDFCQVRYGLDDVRQCYAIYVESQRVASERLGTTVAK